jgi:putative hemolysin
MTPRDRIVWLDIKASADAHRRTMLAHPQARYILCDGELDNVVGAVHEGHVARHCAARPLDMRQRGGSCRCSCPESTRALTLLEQFRKTGIHVALVIDELTAWPGSSR